MHIILSPQVRGDTLSAVRHGDTLTINGQAFDFSPLPDGATLPAEAIDCDYIVGSVERVDGQLCLTLLLPITSNASEAARFPEPIIDPADGPLELPQ